MKIGLLFGLCVRPDNLLIDLLSPQAIASIWQFSIADMPRVRIAATLKPGDAPSLIKMSAQRSQFVSLSNMNPLLPYAVNFTCSTLCSLTVVSGTHYEQLDTDPETFVERSFSAEYDLMRSGQLYIPCQCFAGDTLR